MMNTDAILVTVNVQLGDHIHDSRVSLLYLSDARAL